MFITTFTNTCLELNFVSVNIGQLVNVQQINKNEQKIIVLWLADIKK